MPRKISNKTTKRNITFKPDINIETPEKKSFSWTNFLKQNKFLLIAILIIIIGYWVWQNGKGLFFAGSVNGGLISKMELNSRLNTQFGKQMLEVLIGEKLIMDEATKQKISVTQAEIDEKLKEIESSLGEGATLDEMLKQRGTTKADLINQLKLQLTIDKMFGKDVSTSAQEIEEYIKTNGAYLTATESAAKLIEAEQQLRSTKIEQKFTEWFTKIRDEAKILRFL